MRPPKERMRNAELPALMPLCCGDRLDKMRRTTATNSRAECSSATPKPHRPPSPMQESQQTMRKERGTSRPIVFGPGPALAK